FLSLTAFTTYLPLNQQWVESRGQRYAADAQDLLFNGAFNLTRWVHGAELRLERNPHYWNRSEVRLSRIDMPYVTGDPQAIYNLYKDGRIAIAGLGSETLDDALEQGYP